MSAFKLEDMPAFGRKVSIPKSTTNTVNKYKEAYKAVYGIYPTVTIQGVWIKVQGNSARVTAKRLKEMADQLKYRAEG